MRREDEKCVVGGRRIVVVVSADLDIDEARPFEFASPVAAEAERAADDVVPGLGRAHVGVTMPGVTSRS